MSLPRILIIDDDELYCNAMSEVLREEGLETYTAHSAYEAWSLLGLMRPDVIILDLMMPHMDGMDFLNQLRATPTTASIPTIVASGCTARKDNNGAMQAGADGFLLKPFTSRDLQTAIEALLLVGDAT